MRVPYGRPRWASAAAAVAALLLVTAFAAPALRYDRAEAPASPTARPTPAPSSLPLPQPADATSAAAPHSFVPPVVAVTTDQNQNQKNQQQQRPAYNDTDRFLMMNPLYTWYGLTNQMFCYAAWLRYAHDDGGRVAVFPGGASMAEHRFDALFDVAATERALADAGFPVRIAAPEAVPPTALPAVSMNKLGLFLPERSVARNRVRAAEAQPYMLALYAKARRRRSVRHHNFFLRFPWAAAMNPHGEAFFMRALRFGPAVAANFAALRARLPSPLGRRVVAVHVRLEPDAALIRPANAAAPTPAAFFAFLAGRVAPLLAGDAVDGPSRGTGAGTADAGVSGDFAIYLCTGALPPALDRAVADVAKAASGGGAWAAAYAAAKAALPPSARAALPAVAPRLMRRADVAAAIDAAAPLPRAVGAQRDAHRRGTGAATTQDHFRAAVDLLVLSSARAAVVPLYSTFKFAVFARRCGGLGGDASEGAAAVDGGDAAVWTYSVDAAGALSPLARAACVDASTDGWSGLGGAGGWSS